MKPVRFVKMHGAGNDFVLVDDRDGDFPCEHRLIAAMATRPSGIGCEGVILVQRSDTADFKMRFFNPDGSEADLHRERQHEQKRRQQEAHGANESSLSAAAHLDSLRHAEFGAPRARVFFRFLLARQDGFPCYAAQRLHEAAGTNRRLARAGTAVLASGNAGLDDAVFQRMETDHAQPSAPAEHVRRGIHHALDLAQLVVHRDADRLKAALCRMLLFTQGRGGQGSPDDVDEFPRRFDRSDRAARQEYLNGLRHRRVPGDLRIDRIIDEGIGPDDERLR